MKVNCLHIKQREDAFEQDLLYKEWCHNIAQISTYVTPSLPLNTLDYYPLQGA